MLAYQTGTASGAPQLAWLDRTGKVLTTVGTPAAYGALALSPDEKGGRSPAPTGARAQ